ncbi:hypothetical protein GCM10022236_02210 [Microlunatus ginsengisoli]|uniref:WD40-like Beta Propeller Repeat n=1 Tax=Microlunatus ginsengisoli TaxID=363863 RepID=A0ABP6ZAU0_9ACTN
MVWQQQESSDPAGPAAVYRKEVGQDAVQIIRYPSASRASGFAISRDGSRLAYTQAEGTFVR